MRFWLVILCLCLVGFASDGFAANSCGDSNNVCTIDTAITGDTTWIDGNTYVILTDVAVTGAGTDLTISPGAVVKYLPGTELSANTSGRIVATGTSDKNIIFTSCRDQNSYAGSTNVNTSTVSGCSGAPLGSDYNVALWIKSASGQLSSDSFSYLKILDANYGVRLDKNISSIHDSNFSLFSGGVFAIFITLNSNIEIFSNVFDRFNSTSGISLSSGTSVFSGNVFNNVFNDFNSSALYSLGSSTFARSTVGGNFYNNRFSNFHSASYITNFYRCDTLDSNFFNNVFTNSSGYGFYFNSSMLDGEVGTNIFANSFSNFSRSVITIPTTNYLRGKIFGNVFSDVNIALPASQYINYNAVIHHNAYFNVISPGGNPASHAGDQNSQTGLTANPFIGDESDRNFLLNTTSTGGLKLVDAGGVDSNAMDKNNFFNLRTTQLNNKLDTQTIDIGYHYDQNAPYVQVLSPSDSNTIGGTQTIDFNLESGFGIVSGLIARLAYATTVQSSPSGGTQIVSQALNSYSCSAGPVFRCSYTWDLSALADGNFFVVLTGTDSNGSRVDNSDNNFAVANDSSPPVTTSDYNNAWQNVDANVVLTCSDASGCLLTQFRLDSDSSDVVSMGGWQTFDQNILITSDGNYAIDFNSTDIRSNRETTNRIYVLVDKSLPSLFLTITRLTVTGLTASFSYTASATSGIKKYWISTDNGDSFADNGVNTTYSFSISSAVSLPHTKRVYIKAQNNADVNTAANSFPVTFESASGVPLDHCGNNFCEKTESAITCPNDCPAWCGDRACTGTENNLSCPVDCALGCGNRVCEASESVISCPADCGGSEVVSRRLIGETKVSPGNVSELSDLPGLFGLSIQGVQSALGFVSVKRSVVVESIRTGGKVVEQSRVILELTNVSGSALKNVVVYEVLPEKFADLARSDIPFDRIAGSTAISFTVPGLLSQQTVVIEYVFPVALTSEDVLLFVYPFAVAATSSTDMEVRSNQCVLTSDCASSSACVASRCVKGSCYAIKFPDGEPCDVGSVCKAGVCIKVASSQNPMDESDPILWVSVAVIVLALGAIGYEYFKK